MTWKSIKKDNYVKEIHKKKDTSRRDYIAEHKYEKDKCGSTFVDILVGDNDKSILVEPFVHELFKSDAVLEYQHNKVFDIMVVVKNNKFIKTFGYIWESEEGKGFEKYFFDNDQPDGYACPFMSGPSWPLNKSPVVDDKIKSLLEELVQKMPSIKKSMKICVAQLEQPGEHYGEDELVFKLQER